ncbi:MAG: RNA methyltransferase [Bacteroidetes bacterium]|jgi:tRNA G18 (ribose-2'-O)-methylase SpoU|nr:RNA methyltransferase [Bacteroidota bacterium]
MVLRKLKPSELGRLSVDEFRATAKIPLVVVLDNLRSMHNIGSVFRTCDAFAVEKLILCGICAQPPHREIQRTALGATESVAWSYRQQTLLALEELKEQGYVIVGLELTTGSTHIQDFGNPLLAGPKYALVLGNEVDGISDACMPLLDHALDIPQAGTKHSLNVAVAAGIAIWWFWQALTGGK